MRKQASFAVKVENIYLHSEAGLPDISLYNIPKREKYTK
jgi:hypothetical protein